MQSLSSTTNLRSPQTLDETRRVANRTLEKSAPKSDAPKINAPATRLPRSTTTETGRSMGPAAVQRNQVVEASRPNENPQAILSHLSGDRPTLKQSVIEYANEYLNAPKRKHWMAPRTKERLNVTELVLVDFGQPKSRPTSTDRLTPLQYDPASMTVTPLVQLFIANNYDSDQFDPNLRHNGVYRKSDLSKPSFVTATRNEFTAHTTKQGNAVDPDVATTALSLVRLNAAMKGLSDDSRAGAPSTFLMHHKLRINEFFHANLKVYAQARRDQTINNIDQATRRRTDIADGSLQAQPDEPRLDQADEDMLRSALDGSVTGTVKVYPLRIGQNDSINAQRFTDHTGRTVLHMPGEKNPLRGFDSVVEAQTWLADSLRTGGNKRSQEFAQQHFSRNDVTNRMENSQTSVLEEISRRGKNELLGMETAPPLSGDPFEAQATILRKKTIADDTYDAYVAYTTADQQYIEEKNFMPLAGDIAPGWPKLATPVQPSASDLETKAATGGQPVVTAQTRRSSTNTRTSTSGTATLVSWKPSGEDLLRNIQALYPSVTSESSTYARQYMKDVYGLDVDPDKTVLAQFSGRGRGRYVERDLSEAKLTTLSELFTSNFDNNINEGRLDPNTGEFGIYRVDSEKQVVRTGTADDPDAGNHTATPSLINAQTLYWDMTGRQVDPRVSGRPNKNHPNRFFETLTQKQTEFFSKHRNDLTAALKAYALDEASTARNGALNDADYALVRDAFNNTPNKGITVKPLLFDNVEAINALLISNENGRTIAYLPGEDPPFIARDNIEAINNWMGQKLQDASWKETFFKTQFAMHDLPSLMRVRDTIDSGFGAAFGYSRTKDGVVSGGQPINVDPFLTRANEFRYNERKDLPLLVKSNTELSSGQMLHTAGHIIPFPNTLAAILAQGRTQQEGREGIVGDVLLAPLEVLGAGKAATKLAHTGKKVGAALIGQSGGGARWLSGNWPKMRPLQQVNGKLGYRLSPEGSPRLPERSQGTVLPPPSSSATEPARTPAGTADGHRRQAGGGIDNPGFVHTSEQSSPPDTVPIHRKKAQAPKPPESIELKQMKNDADGASSIEIPTGANTSGARQTSFSLDNNGTPSTSTSRRQSAAQVDLDPDPTAEQLTRAKQIIGRHGQSKTSEPAWLKQPDWLTDEFVQRNGFTLPSGTTTVDQMIALQQRDYANRVNRHTMRLAEAYEANMKPSEINALLEAQKLAQGEQKSLILSQWAQINPTSPATAIDLNSISALETWIPTIKKQSANAIAELKQKQAARHRQMQLYLEQNMKNYQSVMDERRKLQAAMDADVKKAADDLVNTLKKQGFAVAGTAAAATMIGAATKWIVDQVKSK